MKQAELVKILAQELGTTDVNELNKLLKAKDAPKTKYRCAGKKLGHLGVTGAIKAITDAGVKVIGVNKVTLVLFSDIDGFEKAKLRSERPVYPKAAVVEKAKKAMAPKKTAAAAVVEEDDEDDEEIEDEDFDADEAELVPIKFRKKASAATGKAGSKFIPGAKKK
jgi:hypothetical protein